MNFSKRIKIGKKFIGENEPVFIIAEIGVNHNGDIDLAKKMIILAKEAGVDAVKFQSYKTENIILKNAPSAEYHKRAMKSKESWFDLLKRLELTESQHKVLFNFCKKHSIIFLSTPYDIESAKFLNSINVPAFKIASTDVNNIPLIKYISRFKKPILLACGLSNFDELKDTVQTISKSGNKNLVVLHTTSNYPPDEKDANLKVLLNLKDKFNVIVGYSDHYGLTETAISSVSLGAKVYEVHFTLDKNLPGPDHKSSVTFETLKNIVNSIRKTEKLLGSNKKIITPSEKETALKMKKSIVTIKPIRKGEIFSEENIGIKRPGNGLPPIYFEKIIGKKAKRDLAPNMQVKKGDY